ncbi:MAG: glycosyltransferase [Parabacteroides sp.]|nr:glycosyltransferase [Parabacteroides sp.]
MRIAFVTPKMIIGGAETYILTKSNWLVNHGYSVVVISEGGENVKNLPDGVKHIEFKTEISPASFSFGEYRQYIDRLSAILLNEKVDLIEVHNSSPVVHIAMSFLKTGIPYLVNILNERSYACNPLLNKITRNISSYRLCYTLTSQMASYISSRIGKDMNATILPIPVKGIASSGEKQEGDYILSVCRMAPDKMYVRHLIKDFSALMCAGKLDKQYKLLLVGEGELYEKVKETVNRANQSIGWSAVELLGTVTGTELEKLYRGAKLYVGTGTSLLLGASCGKPCIIPGFTRQTMPYAWGIWGERKEDKDVLSVSELQHYTKTSYADLILTLVNNPHLCIQTGLKAKKLFDRYYDSSQIMHRWEEEYARVTAIFTQGKNASLIAGKSDIRNTIRFYRPLWLLRSILHS